MMINKICKIFLSLIFVTKFGLEIFDENRKKKKKHSKKQKVRKSSKIKYIYLIIWTLMTFFLIPGENISTCQIYLFSGNDKEIEVG